MPKRVTSLGLFHYQRSTMPIDYLAKRPEAVCDTECFPNYWSIGFRTSEGRQKVFELFDGTPLDKPAIARVFKSFRVFTFNGIAYDMPMILYAMKGATNDELKTLNDELIVGGLKHWQAFDKYGLEIPDFVDHVDLWNVAPSAAQMAGLKKYAGMMHSKTMRDLPYSPDHVLAPREIEHVRSYHGNDLQVTDELRDEMGPQLALRAQISAKYGIDFRSKSDAQCGEAVIKHLVEKRVGKRIYKPDIKPGPFFYVAPAYVKFKTPYMQQMLGELLRAPFVVRRDGYVEPPAMFGKKKGKDDTAMVNDGETYEGGSAIIIGDGVYKMGIGGLHSQESKVTYLPQPGVRIVDRDVRGYYPRLMINSGFEPDNMKGHFREILLSMVTTRDTEKELSQNFKLTPIARAIHKSNSESLKIFTNGIFGKTGSPYSIVYAPRMMIQTTVTGQLSILMLIEDMVLNGFKVISANTDGFVTLVPDEKRWLFEALVFDWECTTTLETEEAVYRSLHSRDVNNYLAIKVPEAGEEFSVNRHVKRKGAYAPSGRGIPAAMGLKKTPDVEVCSEAAIAFLLDGTPVQSTVRNCQDIRKFVTVRTVKGGGQKNDETIGKVVRYYYADDNPGPITYISSGNRVPSSEGAEPCMELPDELPRNIDYAWYEREALAILDDMGVDVPDPTLAGRKGFVLGRRDDQKTLHTIDASTGIALCGAQRTSRRDNWIEHKSVPEGMRDCAKCRKLNLL